MLSSRTSALIVLKPLLIVSSALFLSACDSGDEKTPQPVASEPVLIDAEYAIWPTVYETTPKEFGESLKQNPELANEICNSDLNAPQGYSLHFAAMANHLWSRSDLIDKYELDPNGKVTLGNTGRLLAQDLESVIMQQGAVNTEDEVVKAETAGQVMRFTFSRDGAFSGYCEDTKGYTPIYRADASSGEMRVYSMSCQQKAGLVCMSVK